MTAFAPQAGLARAARLTLIAAATIFLYTIVIGILNGLDVWDPGHDTLMSHVHSGTLGWITLGVGGMAFLMLSETRSVSAAEQRQVMALAWALVISVTLYVVAFLLGDSVFSDRIQRPIFGTLLFVVVIAALVWMTRAYRLHEANSPARLGILLAWISLLIGSAFGIILGLFTSNGSVPGLDDDTAARFADAHPPAMVIGYLLVAAFAVIEWLLHDGKAGRAGYVQMWLLFAAGVIVNVGFVTGNDEQLVGPANVMMIAAGFIMLWRSRAMLTLNGWRGSPATRFPLLALLFLVAYLVLLTVLVSWIIQDAVDFDALTESQDGLLITFDHAMFVGVITNVLFGVMATRLDTPRTALANRVLWWGLPVGLTGFGIGLITTSATPKRIFAPIMGLSLIFALSVYVRELVTAKSPTIPEPGQ